VTQGESPLGHLGFQLLLERYKEGESDETYQYHACYRAADNATALQLGMAMVKYAQKTKAPQTVFDIRRNAQILFHAALNGSTADNEYWVNAKIATMNRFLASTERKKLEYRAMMGADWLKSYPNGGGDPVKFWNLTSEEATGLVGGGFPITIKGVGFIGTIVASGGPDSTDHDFIITVLKKFLNK
jgi:uncharacterized protein (UPF0303 family)